MLPNNAAFIAAFNPETAKALLDRLAQVEALEQAQRPTCATCKHWFRWKRSDGSVMALGKCEQHVNARHSTQPSGPASTSEAFGCTLHEAAPPTPEATR